MTERYESGIERLIEGIHTDYDNWCGGSEFSRDLEISVIEGRKFDKIIQGNSVWGFVAKGDGTHKGFPYVEGDVFMAASWRAPAKHVRGSIYKENQSWFAWTGPRYLR